MAPSRTDLASSIKIVYARANVLRSHFEELRYFEFPADCLTLVSFVSGVCDRIVDQLETIANQIDSSGTLELSGVNRLVKRYGSALDYLHESCEYLQEARFLSIPANILLLLADTGNHLVPDSHCILRADSEYNYSFLPIADDLNRIVEAAGITDISLPSNFSAIGFPIAEKDNTILNCVLMHEHGHFICEAQGLVDKVWRSTPKDIQSAILQDVAASSSLKQAQLDLWGDWEQRLTWSTFGRWLGELVADMIATRLIGPAFMFSLTELMRLRETQDNESGTHPSNAIRINYVLEELTNMGWEPILLKIASGGINEAREIAGTKRKKKTGNLSYEVAFKSVERVKKIIKKTVRAACKTLEYLPETYLKQESSVRELLSKAVPPGEIQRNEDDIIPVNPLTILNTGWRYYLAGMTEWDKIIRYPERLETDYQKRSLLNRLLLKALEISYLRSAVASTDASGAIKG